MESDSNRSRHPGTFFTATAARAEAKGIALPSEKSTGVAILVLSRSNSISHPH